MNWIQSLASAIDYIEAHLTEALSVEAVARQTYTSSSHFQFIFHVVMGLTVSEYIRNRRLSLAAQDLLRPNSKVIDVALRYQYDTPESFSKAFNRFHGVAPSKIRPGQARLFRPLTITVTVQGGFAMSRQLVDAFHGLDWSGLAGEPGEQLTAAEKYNRIVEWARAARGQNPGVFDALTQWIRDDAHWSPEQLAENEQILMHGVFARFKEQNARLRAYLRALEPSGVVNAAVFGALDRFDEELSGVSHAEPLRATVARVFADFSAMRDRGVREQFAGSPTGPTGTDSVDVFGYVNYLKDCDAQVQWALFMPALVERQQQGFKVDRFEYRQLPALRLIGREASSSDQPAFRQEVFRALDALSEHQSGFDYDLLFSHHNGLGVDVGPHHAVWGRFMQADAPVPEGMLHLDFVSRADDQAGPPYASQFAFATFSGDLEAMHQRAGYDVDAMYDVTRNIILGQGVNIPYPDKYWTAEVFLHGCEEASTAYLFSVILEG